jgi:hypothetical protein
MPFDFSSYRVQSGEKPASSAKFNNFLAAVQAALNDFPAANLHGFPADASKFLDGSGNWSIPVTGMAAVYTKTTPTDVVNTAVQTDLFGNAFTIGAGKVAAGASIKIWASGDYLNNHVGNNHTIDLGIQLGGVSLYQSGPSDLIGSSANRRSWWFHAVIQAITTASQIGGGHFSMGDNNLPTIGTGVIHFADSKLSAPLTMIQGAVNMVGSQTLKLLVTHGQGSPAQTTVSMRCNWARVEVTS